MSQAPLHIQNTAELFSAISASDMQTRLCVLEAICADPQGALGLEVNTPQDIPDFLIQEFEQNFVLESRAFLLTALCALPTDPRIGACLERVWFFSESVIEQISAATRLMQDREPRVMANLTAALLGSDANRAESIAHLWQPSPSDAVAIRLRLALVCPEQPAPSLESNLDAWLLELRGVLSEAARTLLEVQPEATLEALVPFYQRLSPECQVWLLGLAGSTNSPFLELLTAHALRQDHSRLAALETISALPAPNAAFAAELEVLATDPNPQIRAGAIRAGAAGNNRQRALSDQARTVRIAAIRQLQKADTQTLLELLTDPDWRIRSVASQQLANLGADVHLLLEPYLGHEQLEVRMAAARVMVS
jgi:hypothetical protein